LLDPKGEALETTKGRTLNASEYEPTGHLQVRARKTRAGTKRSYFAFWQDAAGKHGRRLGFAHVKDSGRKTPRGAVVWRAGDGPKPSPNHLTPKDAKHALQAILRDAPRRVLPRHDAGTLREALDGSLVERLRDGKVDKSRSRDYEAMHGRLCRELGGDRLVTEFNTRELTEFIRGLEAQKFIGSKRARQARAEGTLVKEVSITSWIATPSQGDPRARRRGRKRVSQQEAFLLESQGFTVEKRTTKRWALCSPASIETKLKYRDLLGSAFAYSVAKSWIHDNPVDDVPRPAISGIREGTLRRSDFYDKDEVARLLKQAPGVFERALWLCGCHAGFRLPGEAQGLVWGSVDFKANVIRAQDAWKRGERRGTKTGKTTAIPMTPQLRSTLGQLKQRGYRTADDDPVFTLNAIGNPAPANKMREDFQTAAKQAGLKRIRMYNLRHSFGTSLAASGRIPNRTIQELMRHRKASTTEIYTAYSPQPDLERQLSTALEVAPTAVAPTAVVAGPTTGRDDRGSGNLDDLRRRLIDRLDEHVPAKWLREVEQIFDDVAREVVAQG
jgi:integrase